MKRSGLEHRMEESEELEPEVTDVGLLVTPQPRGLGLDLDDRSLVDTLRKNPESLSKEAVQYLLKRHFITSISKKVFAVRATSLPNIVRAIGRLLTLANGHNRKMWEEFRGSGALEELMTRMGVLVGEEHLELATDLLHSFLPLLYVGDGLDDSEDSGIEYMDKDRAGGGEECPSETRAEGKVRNKYAYQVLVRGFEKMATLDSKAHLPAFIDYCLKYLDAIMRVIAAPANLEGLMSSHPLVPIFERLGELPPEVAYKACKWTSYICKANRCACTTEFSAIVEALRLLSSDQGLEVPSFRVYNIFRALRYLVVSTVLIDPKFKFVWNQTGLLEHLLGAMSTDRPNVAPFTISLAVDTVLWLVRGCTKNARTVANGAGRAVEFLLSRDTHFVEGNILWVSLMRELAVEVAHPESGDEAPSPEFVSLLHVLLRDLDRRFLACAFDDATGDVFGNAIAAAYAHGLKSSAEGVVYSEATWDPCTGRHPPPTQDGKTFQQCILTLHALIALLVPDMKDLSSHQGVGSMGGTGGGISGALSADEISHDEIGFVTPIVLLLIARHRGQCLCWLTVKASSPPLVQSAFAKILRVRRAFLRAGGVARVLGVLERCITKLEHDEWPLSGLCLHGTLSFNGFASADESGFGRSNVRSGLETTTMAEFLGCSLVVFACATSRIRTANGVEGVLDGVEGEAWPINPRLLLSSQRALAALLFRLLRKTMTRLVSAFQPSDPACRALPLAILQFLIRFLLTMALGGHGPVVEHVVSPRVLQGLREGGPLIDMPLNLATTELCSPRAALLVLELMAEFPLARLEFDFLLPQLLAVGDLFRRLLRSERNLEAALDGGLIKSLLYAATRPAAGHASGEELFLHLLHHYARLRVSAEELRCWLNMVLRDYSDTSPQGEGLGEERIEGRRLKLLKTLVEVSNGHPPGGDRNPDYLQRPFGHLYGSTPLVVFDPIGDEQATQGPRLTAPSLHPEGLEDSGSGGEGKVRPWPPSKGYTFAAWFCVESYGPFTRYLPLVSLTEDNEVLLSVDLNEGIFRIATGSSKEKDCVARCETLARVAENAWCHVTIVHSRSSTRSRHSGADVWINGSRVATGLKLNYPRPSSGLHNVKGVFGQGAATTMGQAARVKWALGPTYLLSEPLSDGAVVALFATGPWACLTFNGEDGAGSVPLSLDVLSPAQLRAFGGHAGMPLVGGGGGSRGHGGGALSVGETAGGAASQLKRSRASSERHQFSDLSAVLLEPTGISPECVVLCLTSREASETPTNLEVILAYGSSAALPLTLSGGAVAVIRRRVGDAIRHACQSPLLPAMMLAERARSVEELRLSLEFLLSLTHANPLNVTAMEKGHFYAVLSQLLRRKSAHGLIVEDTVKPLLAMVGRLRLTVPEGLRAFVAPLNVQAFQHLLLSFDIWKRADPKVHKLIIKSLQDCVAITESAEGDDPQRLTQDFNLRRLQSSAITRAFLYMLMDSENKYDLLLNMVDLVYLVLTRNREAAPSEDLSAVASLLLLLLSPRFIKLYVEQQVFGPASPRRPHPNHHPSSSSAFSSASFSSFSAGPTLGPTGTLGRAEKEALAGQLSRHARLKVIRRAMLRLLLRVAENYVARGESFVHALLRAFPPRHLLFTCHHFGDAVFWAGAGGKFEASATLRQSSSQAPGTQQAHPSSSTPSGRQAPSNGRQRHALRRQDPVSASLALQLLVLVMPSLPREVEKNAFRLLAVALPCLLKAITVHTETDMPKLTPDCETWGRFHVWSPKRLRLEKEEVSAFFDHPAPDLTWSICSPTYAYSLHRLYRCLFAALVGGEATLSAVELGLESAQRDLPPNVLHCPAMLPSILCTLSAAAAISTVEGLGQTIALACEGRQAVRADLIDVSGKDFLPTRAAAARHVAERSLRLLVNLHVRCPELKELLRGERDPSASTVSAAQSVLTRSVLKLSKSDELLYELVQVFYSGLCASLAVQCKPKVADKPVKPKPPRPTKARSPSSGGGQRHHLRNASATGTQEIDLTATQEGDKEKTASPAAPEVAALLEQAAGSSPICLHVLRLLLAVGYDRLLYTSKAMTGLQAILDVLPRDEALALCFHADDAPFRDALQAYFRSVVMKGLMRTVRDRLLEGGAQGASALLSASHHKLSHNLSRFFGHVASMTFLAKSWAEPPPQLPSITHSLPPRDFWLLHSLQFFVDLLSGVVVAPPPGDTSLGANFRVKPTKSGALGDLFGLSKWIGDELDEWIVSAIDFLRRLVLTGLGWLDDGLERSTVYKLFEYIIRYLPLLLPQAHSPRAAELDRQFLAGLMIFVYELTTSEVGEYREMVAYILREVLTSAPHRKMLEPMLTVPMLQPPGRGGKKEADKVVPLSLLNFNNKSDEGFDLALRINVSKLSFLPSMPNLPPPRNGRNLPPPRDFGFMEYNSWIFGLPQVYRDHSIAKLEEAARSFRQWPESTAGTAIAAYHTHVQTHQEGAAKYSHEVLVKVTKTVSGWRKDLQVKQDMELRRQVRWRQERLDRETFGARQMDVLFSELLEGCSLATPFASVLGLDEAARCLTTSGCGASLASASPRPPLQHGESMESNGSSHGAPHPHPSLNGSGPGPIPLSASLDLSRGWVLESDDPLLLCRFSDGVGQGDLCLDSAEGPMRVRKKLLRSNVRLGPGSTSTSTSSSTSASHGKMLPESKADEPPPPPGSGSGLAVVTSAGGSHVAELTWQGAGSVHLADFFDEEEDDMEEDTEEEGDTADEEEEEDEEEGVLGGRGEGTAEAGGGGAGVEDVKPKAKRGHVRVASNGRPMTPAEREKRQQEEQAGAEEEEDKGEDLVGADDKLKPFLVPGDGIQARYNCARVQGVYSHPGILLLGEGQLYIIDNYKLEAVKDPVARRAGKQTYQVVEVNGQSGGSSSASHMGSGETGISWASSPQAVLQNEPVALCEKLRAKCTPDAATGPSHRCLYFSFEDVSVVYKRRYLLRHVAIEVFLANGGNHLIIFDSPEIREHIHKQLVARCESVVHDHSRSPLDEIQSFLNIQSANSLQQQWVRGEISNFQYLMHLNTLAGRSYNDLTQYPVFPWVIADWTSEELDLNNPATFRDLTKPMGALNPAREQEFRERYEVLKEAYDAAQGAPEVRLPFHCGTHYSSAGIVLYYMIRIQPFAEQHVRLQSGRFDHSDRLFSSMHKSWLVASGGLSGSVQEATGPLTSTNTQDVRELVPEFFYLPDFLENKNQYEFGKEVNGQRIDDVVLPPWAKGSAQEFIRLHRQVLESDYVSRHLHSWIDLIFGNKQRPSYLPGGNSLAEEHCNVFYYLTYENAIDLEAVEDPNLRKAYVEQIHEFGQTPTQLFRTAHPARVFGAPVAEKETGPTWLKKLPLMRTSGAYGSTATVAAMLSTTPPQDDAYLPPRSLAFSADAMFGAQDDGPTPTYDATAPPHRLTATSVTYAPGVPGSRSSSSRAALDGYKQIELKKTLSSEPSLRLLPPRKLSTLVPPLVLEKAEAAARASGAADSGTGLSQRAIGQLVVMNERLMTMNVGCVAIPPLLSDYVAWGFMDDCLRVTNVAIAGDNSSVSSITTDKKPTAVVQGVFSLESVGPVSVLAVGADGRIMVTGSATEPVLHVWALHRHSKKAARRPLLSNCGTLISALHSGAITHLALGSKFGMAVSVCSQNRAALLWDLNRKRVARRLKLHSCVASEPCLSVHVDDVTGSIVLCAGLVMHFYDANGTPLATRRITSEDVRVPTPISACYVIGDGCSPTLMLTGHLDGTLRVWTLELGKWDSKGEVTDDEEEGEEEEEEEEGGDKGPRVRNCLVLQAEYGAPQREARPPVTAIAVSPDMKRFMAGDALGNVSVWSVLPPPMK